MALYALAMPLLFLVVLDVNQNCLSVSHTFPCTYLAHLSLFHINFFHKSFQCSQFF